MKNVLVFQLARFGDVLQTKRLMLSLKQEGVGIHLCVDEALTNIASIIYPYATIHSLPAHKISEISNDNDMLTAVLLRSKKLFTVIKEIEFSCIYTLNSSPLSYALATFFPPEIVVGYCMKSGQPRRSLWSKIASRLTLQRETSPLNLVDYWSFFHHDPVNPCLVNPDAQKRGTGQIGIVVAGRVSRRSLPSEVLAKCVEVMFAAHKGPEIILLGGGTELPLVRNLLRFLPHHIGEKTTNLVGKTSLVDLPEILSSLDCLVTPDTGLMHLAAHMGTPIQAFFLSSAWVHETGPYGMGHTIWQACTDCAPCLESSPCHRNVSCLAPFSDENFLRHIAAGSEKAWPENITAYTSSFDALGIYYQLVKGHDNYSKKRSNQRSLVAEWLESKNGRNAHKQKSSLSGENIDSFYQESDWILP